MDPTFSEQLIELLPDLRRQARKLARSRADADDLVHDTLERALRKQHLYEPTGKLIGWLCMIMRNCRFDMLRRRRIAPMAPLDDMPAAAAPLVAPNQVSVVELAEL